MQIMRGARFLNTHLLLQSQQHFSFAPQLLQLVISAQVGIKKMDNNIPVVYDHPARIRSPFDAAFLFMIQAGFFYHSVCKSVQHSIACGGANNKIICEGDDTLKIEQDDILSFFVFQGIDNRVRKFQCIQMSPLMIV